MKVLLDECVTKRIKPHLSHLKDFEFYTVVEMGWSGVKNGKLMSLCIIHQFDMILTIDKNIMFQQNLEKYPITIIVLNSLSSKLEELILFIPPLSKQILQFEKNRVYIIEKSL